MQNSERSKLDIGIGRRKLLLGATGLTIFAATEFGLAQQVVKEISELQPGEFTWHPDRSPEGPVAIVVSLPEQRVHVYRNGVRIAVSTCSTGKPGHGTPTGVFTVLQKDKHHHSSTYNNAPMPNMNRLTWQGIALHAGNLPGYPASHGCVRLPLEFSELLFTLTHVGTPVIIAGSHTDPYEITHPGMVLGDYAEVEMEDAVGALDEKSHPKDWSEGESYPVTTLIASSQDRTVTLFENSRDIAEGRLSIKGSPKLGEHVFTLQGSSGGQLSWHGVSHHEDPAFPHMREEALVNRISADKPFIATLQQHMHPGMVMIVTDLSTHPDRRSGEDFVIMSAS
jgi:L,D-transpeptidase catalytic domain